MPAVVVSAAAVAGRKNGRSRTFAPVLVNPFKRRRRQTSDASLVEEPPRLPREESSEARTTEDPSGEGRVSSSVGELGEQREVRGGGWPASSPVTNETLSEPIRPVSIEEQWREVRPADPETEDTYIDVDEPYLLTTTPYPSLVWQFSLVPITSFLTVLALILLIYGVWTPETPSSSFASYFGFFVFSAAAWVVSFALRIPLYMFSLLVCRIAPALIPFFSTLVQVLCEEALRLSVLVLTHLRLRDRLGPSDPAFSCIWVLAMGWASAEVAVSVWQGYEQLALYKDVLSPAQDVTAPPPRPFTEAWALDDERRVQSHDLQDRHLFEDPEGCMGKEIEHLVRVRARLELEEVYGIPVPNIPVFISLLQRIDSIILSLALFLHMSASYLQNVARQGATQDPSSHLDYTQAIQDTGPAFLVIIALHTLLSFIWSASILPRIGVHTASYTGVVLALGALFAGLGRWDAL